jgi:hypothetical protein
MAIHTQLPIHKKGIELLSLAFKAQVQMPRGVDFVGQVIKPWRRTTRPRTLDSALLRLAEMPSDETYASGNSYLGLLRQASHSHADRARMAKTLMRRGHAVSGDLERIFQKR